MYIKKPQRYWKYIQIYIYQQIQKYKKIKSMEENNKILQWPTEGKTKNNKNTTVNTWKYIFFFFEQHIF